MKIIDFLKGALNRMFGKSDIKSALHIDTAISTYMQTAIDLWVDMYSADNNDDLKLPVAISSELARLVMAESKFSVSGSDEISIQFNEFIKNLRSQMGIACALGGMAFKPYLTEKGLKVNLIPANRFYPIAYDSDGNITSAVFVDIQSIGEYYYTRLEYHKLEKSQYTVINKCYKSLNSSYLGVPWIEFSVGLAYGTLSEPSEIEKTATEILTSKQRSYVFVSEIQQSLETALGDLVYALNVYSNIEKSALGDIKLTCNF